MNSEPGCIKGPGAREGRGEGNTELAFAVDTVEPMLRSSERYISRPSGMLEWLAIPPGPTRRG